MKNFSQFIDEAKEAKKCPDGKYWCFQDKKCKKIPRGYHLGHRGYLEHDNEENGNGTNGHSNGNGSSNGGSSSNGNGGSSGNGGGNGGGGE